MKSLLSEACVAWYKCDDNAATTDVDDAKEFSDGTAQQNTDQMTATGAGGDENTALEFNGSSDYVDLNSVFETVCKSTFTINMHVKPDDGRPSSGQSPISALDENGGIHVTLSNTQMTADYAIGGEGMGLTVQPSPFADGAEDWHMLTLIFKQLTETTGQVYCYFDGVLQTNQLSASTVTMSEYATTANWILGARLYESFSAPFDGIIDEVMIFNRELADYEIEYLYDQAGSDSVFDSEPAFSRWGKADDGLRNLLAGSETFQGMVEADDATEAKAFIHLGMYEPGEDTGIERPFAMISTEGKDRMGSMGMGGVLENGEKLITIEATLPTAYQGNTQHNNAEMWFKNKLGLICQEMRELSCGAGYLVCRRIDISEGPYRFNPDELKNVIGGTLMVAWGLE